MQDSLLLSKAANFVILPGNQTLKRDEGDGHERLDGDIRIRERKYFTGPTEDLPTPEKELDSESFWSPLDDFQKGIGPAPIPR